jgi:hypothetical protein
MENKENINEAEEPLSGDKSILSKIDESSTNVTSTNAALTNMASIDVALTNATSTNVTSTNAALTNTTSIDVALTNATSTNANDDSEFRYNKNSKQISNIHESTQKEIDKRKIALSKALRNNIKRRLIAQQQD